MRERVCGNFHSFRLTTMKFTASLKFAKEMDRKDPLRDFRKSFHVPVADGKPSIYLTGNSLGLQPKSVRPAVIQELDDWGRLGVEGHFHSRNPWLFYHKFTKKALAKIVGARTDEVVAMNQLTVNLHLMLASFYRPDRTRFKIIAESGAFSSDQYALESQLKWHGIEPDEALVEITPRAGEYTLRTEDILQKIREHGPQLALVFFGGVQYYTGQFFDVGQITACAHQHGALAGFDLAHAVGNVPLALHDDNVDFAVWCSYKYLNSGPGGIAGAFVHERHFDTNKLRLAGWWGHDESVRFEMKKGFIPMKGVDGWQVSNVPILQAAAHLASLEIFGQAGMRALRKKSVLLTGYLEFLVNEFNADSTYVRIITPANPSERGCQLSFLIRRNGKRVMNEIALAGVSTDWREPNVLRAAPAPLYNTFEEVFRFSRIFQSALIKHFHE
jgi:kynureninase